MNDKLTDEDLAAWFSLFKIAFRSACEATGVNTHGAGPDRIFNVLAGTAGNCADAALAQYQARKGRG